MADNLQANSVDSEKTSVFTGKDDISDGYHTFGELYAHRTALFAALCNDHLVYAWKSRKHSDGTMYDGMFIAGIYTPAGDISYHCESTYWSWFSNVRELDTAPKFSGYTPDDVVHRVIAAYAQPVIYNRRYDSLTFSEAVRCAKNSMSVSRNSWMEDEEENEPIRRLITVVESAHATTPFLLIESQGSKLRAVKGWHPMVEDILATDWFVIDSTEHIDISL